MKLMQLVSCPWGVDSVLMSLMAGKWHLGHHTPRYLPTARGFDTFAGYVEGDNYYFSKNSPEISGFSDFMVSNASCFGTSANKSAYEVFTGLGLI